MPNGTQQEGTVQTLENKVKTLEGLLAADAGVMSSWILGGGGLDYDYVFVGTKKVTVPDPKTTDFLKIMLDGSGASWVAAMPVTQDSNAVVIDVTKNRIYLSGEMGG